MKVGVSVVGNPVTVARKAEELGFESIWLGEHPILPVHYEPPYYMFEDGKIPEYYFRIGDPFIGLACAASVTTNVRLGTLCLLPLRNPFLLAKEIATLDRYSGGRVIIAAGAGWLKEEVQLLGVDYSRRWLVLRETVEALRELWTKEEAEYHGRVIDFPPVRSMPKPIQKPYPPILVGAWGEKALRRVAKWGDGWYPSGQRFALPQELRGELETLRKLTEAEGRDFSKLDITVQIGVAGTSPLFDLIEQYQEAGAHRVVLFLGRTEGGAAFRDPQLFRRVAAEEILERLAELSLPRSR